jgi:hypothetical protein
MLLRRTLYRFATGRAFSDQEVRASPPKKEGADFLILSYALAVGYGDADSAQMLRRAVGLCPVSGGGNIPYKPILPIFPGSAGLAVGEPIRRDPDVGNPAAGVIGGVGPAPKNLAFEVLIASAAPAPPRMPVKKFCV